jgi:hypothetical protein
MGTEDPTNYQVAKKHIVEAADEQTLFLRGSPQTSALLSFSPRQPPNRPSSLDISLTLSLLRLFRPAASLHSLPRRETELRNIDG